MSELDVIKNTRDPLTEQSLLADLERLELPRDSVVIAHVSLSQLGWVAGGEQSVLSALLKRLGANGTLVMPSQSSQVSDPIHWKNPPVPNSWIKVLRESLPAYDSNLTPTREMGRVVECLRSHPDSIRSPHPTLSFVAIGPMAHKIVGVHPLSPGLGDSSPLGQLYELDALVLLLGVGHQSNTSLHLAEHRSEWTGKSMRKEGAPILKLGERLWVEYEDIIYDEEDFDLVGKAFEAEHDIKFGPIGSGEGKLFSMREVVDFGTFWISSNR